MAKASAETAFKMAGLAPKDIDVAQIYDCYTIAVVMTLEDYGFCKKGEGGKWVEGGLSRLAVSCRSTPPAVFSPRPGCRACSS